TQDVSLADYVARMKPGQAKIYYVTAETFGAAKHSPHLEVFRQKDVEVLLMYDRIDEWVMTHLTEFEGKPLASVAKGGLDLGGLEYQQEQKQREQTQTEFKDLGSRLQEARSGRWRAGRATRRLPTSSGWLVGEER